jgi:hypothetical protein
LADPDKIPEFSYARRRGGPVVDPAMRRMALGAGGVSVLVILVALVWSGMKPGMVFGPPPVISAPPGPLRVVPADPGGLTVPGANEQIMSGDVSAAPPQLAPAEPQADMTQLSQAAGGQPVMQEPAAIPAPVVAPTVVAAAPAVPAGPVDVQLAAAPDEAGVKKAWAKLRQAMPDVLQDKNPAFVPATVNGQSIWRLLIGGFTGIDDANAFCAQVIAKGAVCTVAAF